jgi:HAD superfamily hydrolase (TIGR01509 family)
MLDMDGTLLDLAFDNYFWRELVPRCPARTRRADPDRTTRELFDHFARKQGSLDWYCLDYWSDVLDLDLKSLKSACSQKIRFLPGARHFLVTPAASNKRMVLVTNGHSYTLSIKSGVVGLRQYFETLVSAHELGFAKEQAEFWPLLQSRLEFDPNSTLFVDDSERVLDAARAFGIRNVIAVTCPDSRNDNRRVLAHRGVPHVANLI